MSLEGIRPSAVWGSVMSLAEAREAAQGASKLIRQGFGPDRTKAGWRNAKHRQQWRNMLDTYAMPTLGNPPIRAIETGEVMGALEPIWQDKPETASRLRGRIESVLDYARARGWGAGENPARWRGHLANLLPARGKIAYVVHHAALPWRECRCGRSGDAVAQPSLIIILHCRISWSRAGCRFSGLRSAGSTVAASQGPRGSRGRNCRPAGCVARDPGHWWCAEGTHCAAGTRDAAKAAAHG